jgi:hypothetical protein
MTSDQLLPFLKQLKLTHDHQNKDDAEATKLLLDTYQREDGYHCPRCDLVTTDPDAFAQHLIDELKTAITNMTTYMPKPKPRYTNPIQGESLIKYPRGPSTGKGGKR